MSKKPRKRVAPQSLDWELRGDPEIERAVRDVRDMEDEEIILALVGAAKHLAKHADWFGAEMLLETTRRWSAAKADGLNVHRGEA